MVRVKQPTGHDSITFIYTVKETAHDSKCITYIHMKEWRSDEKRQSNRQENMNLMKSCRQEVHGARVDKDAPEMQSGNTVGAHGAQYSSSPGNLS